MSGTKYNFTKSVRKHLRAEKAKIRRNFAEPAVQRQKIAELYAKFGATVQG